VKSGLWEYKILHVVVGTAEETRQAGTDLNVFGAYGWEAVSHSYAPNTVRPAMTVLLKRPLDWEE
jgi:hypothetical protein